MRERSMGNSAKNLVEFSSTETELKQKIFSVEMIERSSAFNLGKHGT